MKSEPSTLSVAQCFRSSGSRFLVLRFSSAWTDGREERNFSLSLIVSGVLRSSNIADQITAESAGHLLCIVTFTYVFVVEQRLGILLTSDL